MQTDQARSHWDAVYGARAETALSWHQDVPQPSLDLIAARLAPGAPVIDVGGGASRLVDALLARGLGPVSVLDLSDEALATSRDRLGAAAEAVTWIAADITAWEPPQHYALWHDRTVLHFLTAEDDRAAYVAAMTRALASGGHAVIATFADDGPQKCSGLPVQRYSPAALAGMLERHAPGAFRTEDAQRHDHVTPKGAVQKFQTSVFRRHG